MRNGYVSGLELIPDLYPAQAIILSAFGDRATVVEALNERKALGFVGKDERPERLHQAIVRAIEGICQGALKIAWYPHFGPSDILLRLKLSDPSIPVDAPYCVLRRLYAQGASQIDLKPVTEYYRSSDDVPPLERERSVVFVAQAQDSGEAGHWHRKEIVKLTSSQNIQDEIANYDKYVKHYLPPHRTARIEDRSNTAVLWDLGAIRYTNIAIENRKPLRQWYGEAETRAVIRALEDLFGQTLDSWYRALSHRQIGTVYDYYVTCFPKLRARIDCYSDANSYISIPQIAHRLRNPVVWAKSHAQKSRFVSRWDAYTHGDLHSDNIFVDQYAQTYVIDYERSGPGHLLRDFVELESEIRLRLLPLTMNELPFAFQLDQLLLEPEHPDQFPSWTDILGARDRTRVELRKAHDIICALRQLAFHMTRFEHMDEYYWALLMETLISVLRDYSRWPDQQAAELAKNRALLSAALICERLLCWGKVWPPEEWASPESPETDSEDVPSPLPSLSSLVQFSHGYALLIGVGDTPYHSRWSLPVTVRDGTEVRKALVEPTLCAYPSEQVRLLHDQTASLAHIRDGLDWLAKQSHIDREATVVIYFSGHGWLGVDGRYALIPSDVEPNRVADTVLWDQEFADSLRRIEAKRLLVLIDACHAEGMATAKSIESLPPVGFTKAPPTRNLLDALKQGEGRAVISSSRGRQFSYVRRDSTLSIFTYHLLEALRGATNLPGESTVRVSNLINHLGKTVPNSALNEWQAEQVPWTDQASEDFAVALLLGGKGFE